MALARVRGREEDDLMTNAQERWKELGAQLESLGLKLKLHVEQATSEVDDDVKEGFTRVGKAIEDVFDALGEAVDDDAVRADAKEAGRRLLDAVDATFTEVGDVLRDRMRGS
jgi:Flp pilus assembly pilin Flp